MPGFVLLVRERQDGNSAMRVGFTVTKKIGGAVVRNRMKRRFRALARAILPRCGVAGADHVLIGRSGGIERDFARLGQELEKALTRIREPARDTAPRPPHERRRKRPANGNGGGKATRPSGLPEATATPAEASTERHPTTPETSR